MHWWTTAGPRTGIGKFLPSLYPVLHRKHYNSGIKAHHILELCPPQLYRCPMPELPQPPYHLYLWRICCVIERIHRFNYYILSSKVSQHVESMFYKKSLSLPTHTKQAFNQPTDTNPILDFNSWSDTLDIPCSQDMIIPKGTERDNVRN